ncbi:MAG: phosphoribosyl-AMP cyclohydrolase [Pseudomonadota bacterium]
MLKQLENSSRGTKVALTDVLDRLPYNNQGLIPAIAQDHQTHEVLMLAWMDRQAIETTLAEGRVCYFSRSRNTYWRKGETSGHVQNLVSMHLDCDGDAILIKVDQIGPACHTNRKSCFYLSVDGELINVDHDPG